MKQKNLILMVVAVGCGLVAAFLTSQMSGRPKETQQLEIIVAAKELVPGTQFTKEALKDLVKKRRVNTADVPQNAMMTEDELVGKTLVKALRSDDFVSQGDLGEYRPLQVPEGKSLVSVKLPVEQVTPFVKPTSRIDLLGTLLTGEQKVKGTVLIPNMLVMAVDTETVPAPGGARGVVSIQNVTLAASTDEAKLIRMAETANVRLSFLLHGGDIGPKSDRPWNLKETIDWINNGGIETTSQKVPNDAAGRTTTDKSGPAVMTGIKVWVPKEDLPAGTALDTQLVDAKFQEIDWKGAIPDNVFTNIREQIGKYLIKDVFKGFPVAKTAIGDKMPTLSAKGNQENVEPTDKPAIPAAAPKPKETMDTSYQTPSGTKNYRYEKQDSGKWKLIGEVQADGSVAPVGPGGVPNPNAPVNPLQPQQAPAAPQAAPAQQPEPRITSL